MNADALTLRMKPVSDLTKRVADGFDRMAHRDPNRAMAVAAGALLALRVVPMRWLVRGAVKLAKPALLAFGVCKILDLCQRQDQDKKPSTTPDSHERLPRRPRH